MYIGCRSLLRQHILLSTHQLIARALLDLYFQLHSHSDLFEAEVDEEAEVEIAKMNPVAAVLALIGVTVVTAFCADYLVESIDEFSMKLGVPKVFIGIILLPIGESSLFIPVTSRAPREYADT